MNTLENGKVAQLVLCDQYSLTLIDYCNQEERGHGGGHRVS